MKTPKEMREAALDQQEKDSSKISDLSRYVGFGLVAIAYSILTSDEKTAAHILYASRTTAIVVAAGLGVLTIILDYLQYLAGYLVDRKALKNVEGEYRYNDKSLPYHLRAVMFWAKQVTAIAGAVLFCWTVMAPLV